VRYLLGILAGLAAGFIFTAASIAQKSAIDALKVDAPLFRNLVKSRLWLAGLASSFILGAPLNMASYAAIGPTLPPALASIGLAAVPVLARIFLGERPPMRAYAGAAAISAGIGLLGLSGASMAPEGFDWLETGFLARGSIAAAFAAIFATACIAAGMRSRVAGAAAFALAAGMLIALTNAFMGPFAGELGILVSGRSTSRDISIILFASMGLIAVNILSIVIAQISLRKGRAASVIPLQQAPIQLFPLLMHFLVYRESSSGMKTALVIIGAALILSGSSALGPGHQKHQHAALA
jgi:hypothetical protein